MINMFEWDEEKNRVNQEKHGVSFVFAKLAFADPYRVVIEDLAHSEKEQRYLCFGKVDQKILTIRFTLRNGKVRIFGAAYWRKGKKIYEQENKI